MENTTSLPLNGIKYTFLVGGMCKIPFIKSWIAKQFPGSVVIADEGLETITAFGAAIHGLQVLNREVDPYIKQISYSIACDIVKNPEGFDIEVYDVTTKKESIYSVPTMKSIHEIIEDLIKKYGKNLGAIVLAHDFNLMPNRSEYFKEKEFEKYNNLVHIATKEKLDFQYYFILNVKYFVGDLIIKFDYGWATLYKCKEVAQQRVTLVKQDKREHRLAKYEDFEYVARMFRIEINHVHAVFEDSQKNVYSLYGPELSKCNFKSINFARWAGKLTTNSALSFARYKISDPEVQLLVKIDKRGEKRNNPQDFIINDWGFIRAPSPIKKYESKTDVIGIDLGTTRCVSAISTERKIHIVPFDDQSQKDFLIKSVVSFDESKPITGEKAVEKLKTEPKCVIFDAKLLSIKNHRDNNLQQSIWPFKFNVKEGGQLYLEIMTSKGLQEFSLADINKIFIEQIKEMANAYQKTLHNREPVNKAVITIPKYFDDDRESFTAISSAIQAAKLANIEIIDIIEETHADLLYYLSNEKHSAKIKNGMKIAVFDIGGGSSICRAYEISEFEGEKYATCYAELFINAKFSGRDIDNIITEELEKKIAENLQTDLKIKVLQAARQIKHSLSSEETSE